MSLKKIPKKTSDRKLNNELIKGLSQLSQIGVTMVVCIFIGVFLGRFLDSFFSTSPWLLLLCSFLGVGAGFKYIYDLSKRM